MSKFIINGPSTLKGDFVPSGAKNAALKMIAASLLTKDKVILENCPDITDVHSLISLMESLGAKTNFQNNILEIDPSGVNKFRPDDDVAKKIRASIVLVGPLLARFNKAQIAHPGGCLIGNRPLDAHMDVFRQYGIKINYKDKYYSFSTPILTGAKTFPCLSVTATENAIMTAVLAKGESTIYAAAAEPEIKDLILILRSMGARIRGAGTHNISIEGVKKLSGTRFRIMPDRIEIGTIICASLATGSEITIHDFREKDMGNFIYKLESLGAKFKIENSKLTVLKSKLNSGRIDTRTYPGFSTDLQSPTAVLLTQAGGVSRIFETLFENRFNFIAELNRMGAKIKQINDYVIEIDGPTKLKGANIESSDLRAGAALVIAGLIAEGKTVINNIDIFERGYEKWENKLSKLGVNIIKEK
ncbi:MAG: UDP-N-acetylglucosamine 1-carboxyvinyltransferase [Berkelbacteria bacterium GW2011_GWA2_35_9]|uniref:UDP-N-acetylglucosamine 1-carboxyvinyltransferase n=1 Tax=Berkelbacteria bacterium GW2011_GWA2_35_9 TaxID=1618333 RepID=A0A0G0FNY9_9BACT|nr:MAG: UDP-N-acetylglucosamine 1-carboxyvinyltransferase [Berkelbacteria bacterium GW2011_GWA2_35_9]